jgi:ketosteroid isomerase-like protein
MQLLFRVTTLLIIVLFSNISVADDASDEIKQLLNFVADEWNAGDLDSIRGQFHRDFVLVSNDNTRTRKERYEELEIIMSTGQDHGELSYSDLHVKSLSSDHALVYGKSGLKFKDGTEISSMFSSIYLKTPFGWKAIFTHE